MNAETKKNNTAFALVKRVFLRVGVLPFFLGIALIIFTALSSKFLTGQNLINVARQSVYLVLVSMGQMLVLISGGFDLSVGTAIALTSVVSATGMVWMATIFPDAIWLAIALGALMGFSAALLIGAINGVGVAYFEVSPFIMTLGVSSIGAGMALFLTGGVPVSGLPFAFADTFGFGRLWGIPVPVIVALICIIAMWVFMSRTRLGTQVYAVGGNIKAAHLSAINTKKTLMLAYIICALIASLTGLLLTRSRGIWRSKSRRNYRTGIYRSLRYRRCIASWWYRTCGECRAWRVLHHSRSKRHEFGTGQFIHADGLAGVFANPRCDL